jgi:ABC-type nitrate/sulfonate/bicarbonate transport system permease component
MTGPAPRAEAASDDFEPDSPPPPVAAGLNRLVRGFHALKLEGPLSLLVLAVIWQIATYYLPPFLFPRLETIWAGILRILAEEGTIDVVSTTFVRIIVSLFASLLLGTLLGMLAGLNSKVDRALVPLIQFKQGVPGVCWILFAVLWFRDMNVRIAFIVILSTIPSFFYQARDGIRSVSHDLWEMVRAWRPTRWQMFRKLILPGLIPAILIGLRINFGVGTRTALFAELLAGTSGIGPLLRSAQEQYRIDVVMSWTAILVVIIISLDTVMARSERWLLSWRQSPGQDH